MPKDGPSDAIVDGGGSAGLVALAHRLAPPLTSKIFERTGDLAGNRRIARKTGKELHHVRCDCGNTVAEYIASKEFALDRFRGGLILYAKGGDPP